MMDEFNAHTVIGGNPATADKRFDEVCDLLREAIADPMLDADTRGHLLMAVKRIEDMGSLPIGFATTGRLELLADFVKQADAELRQHVLAAQESYLQEHPLGRDQLCEIAGMVTMAPLTSVGNTGQDRVMAGGPWRLSISGDYGAGAGRSLTVLGGSLKTDAEGREKHSYIGSLKPN